MVLISHDGQAMKASQFDRSCSKKNLEGRFGMFEVRQNEQHSKGNYPVKPKRRYKPRPLVRQHNTPALWRRYLGTRKFLPKQHGLTAKALRNWKMFLLMEADQDPLAMVLTMAHRKFLDILIADTSSYQKPVAKITKLQNSLLD